MKTNIIEFPETEYVYFITNPSMPGLVKVGMTTTSFEQRLGELQSSGVPTPFELEIGVATRHALRYEQLIHRRLDDYRVAGNREFFRMTPAEALAAAQDVFDEHEIVHIAHPELMVEVTEAAEVFLERKRREDEEKARRDEESKKFWKEENARLKKEWAEKQQRREAELHRQAIQQIADEEGWIKAYAGWKEYREEENPEWTKEMERTNAWVRKMANRQKFRNVIFGFFFAVPTVMFIVSVFAN